MSQIDVAHYNKKISDDEFNAGVDKLVRKLNSYTLNVDSISFNLILILYITRKISILIVHFIKIAKTILFRSKLITKY
jgi:hypothetical protein